MRVFLNTNLSLDHKTLLNSIPNITQIPLYHSCLIKPKDKSISSRGIYTAYRTTDSSYLLLIVDFGLFFYTDEASIGREMEFFSNKQNKKVIVVLGDIVPWQNLNELVYSKMQNRE